MKSWSKSCAACELSSQTIYRPNLRSDFSVRSHIRDRDIRDDASTIKTVIISGIPHLCVCDFHRNLNLEEVDLISEKSLKAVEELVLLLKGYVHNNWIFRPRPHINSFSVEEKVYHALRKGNKRSLHRLVTRDRAEDGVSGLQIFLTKLKQPVIPQFIQALAVDENKGITADIVAVDMLGLMRQNLLPRHLRLITTVFDLLHCAVKNTHTDELKGSAVPLSMLPIFFQLEALNIPRWRRLVSVLMEMIRLAPTQLNIVQHPDDQQQIARIPR